MNALVPGSDLELFRNANCFKHTHTLCECALEQLKNLMFTLFTIFVIILMFVHMPCRWV